MIDYTTVQLIKDVKREGSVPTNQSLYEDADFTASMDDCQKMRITPAIMRTRGERFVSTVDYSWGDLTPISGNRLSLTLPPRAIGNRIRQLQLVDSNGVVKGDIPKLNPEGNDSYNVSRDGLFGYIFEDNQIILSDSLSSGNDSLRLKYFRRPNRIVDISKAGKITAVNTMTGSITLDSVPAGFAAGVKIDIISQAEPFKSIIDSETIIAVGGFAISVPAATAALVSIGDYVNFEFETVIPQLPVETHPILIQFTLAKILKSLGDGQGAVAVMADLPALEDSIYELLTPRDEGSENKLIAPGGLWTQSNRFSRW